MTESRPQWNSKVELESLEFFLWNIEDKDVLGFLLKLEQDLRLVLSGVLSLLRQILN